MCDKTLKYNLFLEGKKLNYLKKKKNRQKQNVFSNKQEKDFLMVIRGRMALTKIANSKD